MPITQERFLSVVNASHDILNAWDSIRDFTNTITEPITNLTAAIERSPESPERAAMVQALALLHQLHSAIVETNFISAKHYAAIAVEREHFRKTERRNQKAADAMRRSRINHGGSPLARQQGPIHQGLSAKASYRQQLQKTGDVEILPQGYDVEQDSNYLKLLEEQRTKWNEAEQEKENV